MEKFLRVLSSRKFWAAQVGVVMVVVKAYLPNFPLNEEQLTALVVVIASYILGTAVEDSGLARRTMVKAVREPRREETPTRSSL